MSDDCRYSEALDRKHWRAVWSQKLEQYELRQQQQLREEQSEEQSSQVSATADGVTCDCV